MNRKQKKKFHGLGIKETAITRNFSKSITIDGDRFTINIPCLTDLTENNNNHNKGNTGLLSLEVTPLKIGNDRLAKIFVSSDAKSFNVNIPIDIKSYVGDTGPRNPININKKHKAQFFKANKRNNFESLIRARISEEVNKALKDLSNLDHNDMESLGDTGPRIIIK